MDPGSIASLAFNALGASAKIWDYCVDLKCAPENIQTTIATVNSCRRTIQHLRRIYAKREQTDTPNPDGYDEPDDLCESLREFTKTVSALRQELRPFNSRKHNQRKIGLRLRIKWRWKKKELQSLRNDLYNHQRTLNLGLTLQLPQILREVQQSNVNSTDNTDAILAAIKKLKRRQSMSDDENQSVSDMLSRYEMVNRHVRYIGSYDTINRVQSAPSSEADLASNRSSFAGFPPLSNLDAVLAAAQTSGPTQYPVQQASMLSNVPEPTSSRPVLLQEPQDNLNNSYIPEAPSQRAVDTIGHETFEGSDARRRRVRRRQASQRQIISDDQGRTIAVRPVPEVRSAPSGLFDVTQGMNDSEIRAYISGMLAGQDSRIEQHIRQVRSGGSLPLTDFYGARQEWTPSFTQPQRTPQPEQVRSTHLRPRRRDVVVRRDTPEAEDRNIMSTAPMYNRSRQRTEEPRPLQPRTVNTSHAPARSHQRAPESKNRPIEARAELPIPSPGPPFIMPSDFPSLGQPEGSTMESATRDALERSLNSSIPDPPRRRGLDHR